MRTRRSQSKQLSVMEMTKILFTTDILKTRAIWGYLVREQSTQNAIIPLTQQRPGILVQFFKVTLSLYLLLMQSAT